MKQINFLLTLSFASVLLGSCKKENAPTPPGSIDPPVTLTCDHFLKNANAVLKDNPKAPIDYIITCQMSINDDVTIEPGTTIAFQTDAGLIVNLEGSLNISGTADKPILLTGTDQQKGTWSGIIFYSNDVKNKIHHTTVEYAGGVAFNSNNDRGAVIIYSGGRINMSNSTLRHSATYGLNANYGKTLLELDNNTYTSNAVPMRLRAELLGMASPSDHHTGNDEDKIELNIYTSSVSSATTWRKTDVPYKMVVRSSPIPQLSVDAKLTIEPGVQVEMSHNAQIMVRENGALWAVGSAADPIIFRGLNNTPGSWSSIYFDRTASTENRMQHMVIRNAGGGSEKGAVMMWGQPTLTVSDVAFHDIKGCAIYAAPSTSSPNRNLTTSNLTFSNVDGEICGD